MAKQKILTEQEVALKDMIDARVELQRIQTLFNYVEPDYFEIANMELTIAQMRYEVSMKKLKKICGEDAPQMPLFFVVSY